jgi:hypothetical protein
MVTHIIWLTHLSGVHSGIWQPWHPFRYNGPTSRVLRRSRRRRFPAQYGSRNKVSNTRRLRYKALY